MNNSIRNVYKKLPAIGHNKYSDNFSSYYFSPFFTLYYIVCVVSMCVCLCLFWVLYITCYITYTFCDITSSDLIALKNCLRVECVVYNFDT